MANAQATTAHSTFTETRSMAAGNTPGPEVRGVVQGAIRAIARTRSSEHLNSGHLSSGSSRIAPMLRTSSVGDFRAPEALQMNEEPAFLTRGDSGEVGMSLEKYHSFLAKKQDQYGEIEAPMDQKLETLGHAKMMVDAIRDQKRKESIRTQKSEKVSTQSCGCILCAKTGECYHATHVHVVCS